SVSNGHFGAKTRSAHSIHCIYSSGTVSTSSLISTPSTLAILSSVSVVTILYGSLQILCYVFDTMKQQRGASPFSHCSWTGTPTSSVIKVSARRQTSG